jgi:hypothetical protein
MDNSHLTEIKKLADNEQSYGWLKSGDMKEESESIKVAAQKQEISTNYFKTKFLREKMDSKCIVVDVAIPEDRNVMKKEAEKKLEYRFLCIEIQRM